MKTTKARIENQNKPVKAPKPTKAIQKQSRSLAKTTSSIPTFFIFPKNTKKTKDTNKKKHVQRNLQRNVSSTLRSFHPPANSTKIGLAPGRSEHEEQVKKIERTGVEFFFLVGCFCFLINCVFFCFGGVFLVCFLIVLFSVSCGLCCFLFPGFSMFFGVFQA